ncbi:hypothetical protein [Clostridium felsineum]|uniref:hypothetical protein n=1 Tax=Clostridium felsineum TaxID=36839 RepID=UPI00098C8C5D|nr:hypothetical protein [Clostridium felsineum]URZ04292.1 hypothetical protein CLAUR_043810 [Clostridium felsineum]
MRKFIIFYILDVIWIVFFLSLAIMRNLSTQTGLLAIENLGRFVLFSVLCFVGIIALVIVVIIQLVYIKKK